MSQRKMVTIDGNEAAANTAHRINEVIAIYPITPSSNMGEWADQWSSEGRTNIWGTIPLVVEMQSEGGAAGAVHGALTTGALTTTFTAAQGLLLMIPNMYKIAGELTPTVFHVSARTLAAHALSIFGDHSDVMSARSTGFGFMASNSVQEIHDFAAITQAASLASRIPFVHFFDGFRSSHEVQKMEELDSEILAALLGEETIRQHRMRGLSPDRPMIRGTAQNPDVFFQAKETSNPFYDACPGHVEEAMARFAELTGRRYNLFDYVGAPDAERVIVLMGSGAETAQETVEYLTARGEKVGVLKVRLYRPFAVDRFLAALPKSVRRIAILDRTKEPGAAGEPLYTDICTAVLDSRMAGNCPLSQDLHMISGRYGLSSKEFNPAMVKAVFDELTREKPKSRFTVGINDDVSHTSIDYDPDFSTEPEDVVRAIFFGLGADGTVGANKNSIKIIGEDTDFFAQGYFVYDSKKAGAVTVSHLRFGPRPIRSTYLISKASFIACHQTVFLERYDMLQYAVEGATFLLNTQAPPDKAWDTLPKDQQQILIDRKMKFYVIDAYAVARETGMGARINTIMQTCFFAISGVLPREEAIQAIKNAISKTYGIKGEEVVKHNFKAVDGTLAHLHEVKIPGNVTSTITRPPVVAAEAPEFVHKVIAVIMAGNGDSLPVSALPVDGTFPTSTTQWEKRSIALEIPAWDPEICIQCGRCSLSCPHAAIRPKVYDPGLLGKAPPTFKSADYKGKEYPGMKITYQVAPEDCTGCGICAFTCPAHSKSEPVKKALTMTPLTTLRETERANFKFFLEQIPDMDRSEVRIDTVKGSQLLRPLFEYSGACAGCGETPYYKLLTQLFGDRAIIANATGCSSIYGGNLPTTPFTVNNDGRGPAWSNSLFEDNAEFGFGFRLTIDKQGEYARELLGALASKIGDDLVKELLEADQSTESGIQTQRERVAGLRSKLKSIDSRQARDLDTLADFLVRKSVWVVGGDGWAYDIGYGGLDHVLAVGRDVNMLVLDTEVYSNTGGQASKSTPRGAVAKFASGGRPAAKKDLALMAALYGNVYVAKVAMGARDLQTIRAFLEADAYKGTSIIVAYSHCIAHGIDMTNGLAHQKAAVESGHFPLFRYNPDLKAQGKNPFQMDSAAPRISIKDYAYQETRYKMLTKSRPEDAARLIEEAQGDADSRWRLYEAMASMKYDGKG